MRQEDIQRRAFIHWQWRQRNNIPGDADNDWFIAENTLRHEELQQQRYDYRFHYPEEEK